MADIDYSKLDQTKNVVLETEPTDLCDWCDTPAVHTVTDSWGGVHGRECEDCYTRNCDREPDLSGPTYRERWQHEAEQAQKLKRS